MQTPLSGALGMTPFSAVSVPSGLMIGYAFVYLMGALYVAINIFQNRDL
jgi:hypothetical protein